MTGTGRPVDGWGCGSGPETPGGDRRPVGIIEVRRFHRLTWRSLAASPLGRNQSGGICLRNWQFVFADGLSGRWMALSLGVKVL